MKLVLKWGHNISFLPSLFCENVKFWTRFCSVSFSVGSCVQGSVYVLDCGVYISILCKRKCFIVMAESNSCLVKTLTCF